MYWFMQKTKQVSIALDDFILGKDKTFWYVKLSNGEIVYQDDERPGLKEPKAWNAEWMGVRSLFKLYLYATLPCRII